MAATDDSSTGLQARSKNLADQILLCVGIERGTKSRVARGVDKLCVGDIVQVEADGQPVVVVGIVVKPANSRQKGKGKGSNSISVITMDMEEVARLFPSKEKFLTAGKKLMEVTATPSDSVNSHSIAAALGVLSARYACRVLSFPLPFFAASARPENVRRTTLIIVQ